MKPETFFAEEAARLRAEYEGGALRALAEAVWLFSENGQPLPTWAAEAVLAHLGTIYNKGLGGRRGRGGGHRAVAQDVHRARWEKMDGLLRLQKVRDRKVSVAAAARDAAERLKGTAAQGSARQVQASWRKVEAEKPGGD